MPQRFSIPEVWFWRKDNLEIWVFEEGIYTGPFLASRLLPDLPLDLLIRCATIPDWITAIDSFRKGLSAAS